jgi:hypothetical protein
MEPNGGPPADAPAAPGAPAAANPAGAGCVTALAIVSALVLLLAVIAVGVAAGRLGAIVPALEKGYIENTAARAGLEPAAREELEKTLREYDEARKAETLGPKGWWAAGQAFERSPATIVLSLLNARANLDLDDLKDLPAREKDRAREVLARLARGVASGAIGTAAWRDLVRAAGIASAAGEEETRALDGMFGAEEIRRFTGEGERLADREQIPAGSAFPDLASLVRRDLLRSLAEARGGG